MRPRLCELQPEQSHLVGQLVAHEGNRLSLLLESRNELPEYFASAPFVVAQSRVRGRPHHPPTRALSSSTRRLSASANAESQTTFSSSISSESSSCSRR